MLHDETPAGWQKTTLGQIARITAGGDYDAVTASPHETDRHPFPVYANAIERSETHSYSSESKHPENAVTITARGTLGRAEHRKSPFTAIGRLLVVWPNPAFNSAFLAEYINNRIHFVIETTGVPQLIGPQAGSYEIALPESLPEQHAIAEALADTDGVIAGLERLIAKKRQIKQGAMQDLLTARRRLPGFSGEWIEVPFDLACDRINAKEKQVDASEYAPSGALPVVDQGKNRIAGFTNREEKRFSPPDDGVIVFGDHTRVIKHISFDFAVGADGIQLIVSRKGFDARFLSLILEMTEIPNTGYNRHFKFLKEMSFVLPQDKIEQTAIATVLSDMDAEIRALDGRLTKARAVKEGMMQVLLTGRVRLV